VQKSGNFKRLSADSAIMRIAFILYFICGIFTAFAEDVVDIRPRFTGGLNRFILRLKQSTRLARQEKQPELAALLDSFYFPIRNYATSLRDSVIGDFNPVFLQNRTSEFYLHLNIFEDKLREFNLSLGDPPDNSESDEEQPASTGNNEETPISKGMNTVEEASTLENETKNPGFSLKADPDKTTRKIIAETQKDLGRAKRGCLNVITWLVGHEESQKLKNKALKLRQAVPSKENEKKDPMAAYRHIPMLETPETANQNKK
jgi:hypothetical protein